MTHHRISARGIAALLERETRDRGALKLGAAVGWLRELVPDDRTRAGIALALNGERVAFADDDGRPALVTAAPTEVVGPAGEGEKLTHIAASPAHLAARDFLWKHPREVEL